jgi:predicted ArsR family transcriptional regulator
LIEQLKRSGPCAVGRIAQDLALTGSAVRQHLATLRADGLVETVESGRRTGPGRRAALWRVTDKASHLFPERHGELSVELLADIRSALGEDGLRAVIDARIEHQRAAYGDVLAGAEHPVERLQRLALCRSAEGYMAEVIAGPADDPPSWVLVEHHCPIARAARSCGALCQAELELFRHTLGPGIVVERVRHLVSGDDRCAYQVVVARPDGRS